MSHQELLAQAQADMHQPTPLFIDEDHRIYWLGITENTAFRCNCYLLCSGDDVFLIDPGSVSSFEQVHQRVAQIVSPESITGLILCHQDPDVAASLPIWLNIVPDAYVFTSPRAQVLLPHYGCKDYRYWDIEQHYCWPDKERAVLQFITAPHLHSPAAFVSYDHRSGFLFSGDIWAALTLEWQLLCRDFSHHRNEMNMFHMDYMASNRATRGFVKKLDGMNITAILPQHGSIIPNCMVADALQYLRTLQCGTDIAYPELA